MNEFRNDNAAKGVHGPGSRPSLRDRARAIKADTIALYLAYRDPRVPLYAKLWAALVIMYALSPVDLIPDFVPVLGYVDDVILLPLGIALAVRLVPPEVMDEYRQRAREYEARPRSWAGGAVVVLVWVAVVGLAGYWLWKALGR